jgi:DNA polymerase
MIPMPLSLDDMPAGTQLPVGLGKSTIIADMDFETYSEAGYEWDSYENKWIGLPGANDKGLFCTGAARYTEHPSAEVLSLAYDLKDGSGPRLWLPSFDYLPEDLFQHLADGKLIEAWNCQFERWVWMHICQKKYGFPPLPFGQLRDAMAKARAHALPGGLDACSKVLGCHPKDPRGKKLLDKFSIPRNPTKNDERRRIFCRQEKQEAQALYEYNLKDIQVEAEISSKIPDLNDNELKFWQCDQAINLRGVKVDLEMVDACIAIVEQAHYRYTRELSEITNGYVTSVSEIQKIKTWAVENCGVFLPDVTESTVSKYLENLKEAIDPQVLKVRRILQIRSLIGSSSVKKLYAMKNQVTSDGRLHDLFLYHTARTGRASGQGPQPQNLPNSGPEVILCDVCNKSYTSYDAETGVCSWCGKLGVKDYAYFVIQKVIRKKEWNERAIEDAFESITPGDLSCVEFFWDDPIAVISGCLRSLFIAEKDKNLICSDYSAIEAVVLAALAGEQWRLDVFNTHGKIYEMSASKITGIPFEEFEKHKKETGNHHPARKKVGKVAELASGYQGWTGAWKQFGADEFFSEEEIKKNILAWRKASPKIVEMWGGQFRHWNSELYGLEGAAVSAIANPGKEYSYRGITYVVHLDVLYCRLLSGRYLTYHKPRLQPHVDSKKGLQLSFEGWNSNQKYGAPGWIRLTTYGGKLTENVVQATARDILAHAIVNLEERGYPVVLHVHDEIVCEIPKGWGSIEEFELIMSTMPSWAKGWPIKANGGWRGQRYRK